MARAIDHPEADRPDTSTTPGVHAHARRRRWLGLAAAGGLVLVIAMLAILRGGLLGLPPVPPGTTAAGSGLDGLEQLAVRAASLPQPFPLDELQRALAAAPHDLVLGNAYRMAVMGEIRRHFATSAAHGTIAPSLPPHLQGQPIRFLEQLVGQHPTREAALQLALAWVDQMILFPALEIKAPASVESVEILSGILDDHPAYVPALYARGLNYLFRPARLVWPESEQMAPDAASRDIGTAIAIGRQVGGGSSHLKATLAMALGDAYAKEGNASRARSWWQIAAGIGSTPELEAAIERRFAWGDGALLDHLERELDERMRDAAHPLTDLAFIWEGAAP